MWLAEFPAAAVLPTPEPTASLVLSESRPDGVLSPAGRELGEGGGTSGSVTLTCCVAPRSAPLAAFSAGTVTGGLDAGAARTHGSC